MSGKPGMERLESLRKKLLFRDRGIFEKSVYAFRLLSELLGIYPRLTFKGGTSLLLHIFPPARLSIDVDILLEPENRAGLKGALEKMAAASEWFEGVEEDVRREGKIPKAHYKFTFSSAFSKIPQYVLLDVVFAPQPYKKLLEKDISALPLFVPPTVKSVVRTPTPEGLAGDKMTAVSPNTVGIPLDERRAMEFVKQIIDLGELFNIIDDTDDVRQSFYEISRQECGFRGITHSPEAVLDDITDVAFRYSQYMLKGADNSCAQIAMVTDGLNKMSNHLRAKIGQQDMKVALAKIVYLASVLKGKENPALIKKADLSSIADMTLAGKYQILERLKVVNPEAYFFWVLGVGTKR